MLEKFSAIPATQSELRKGRKRRNWDKRLRTGVSKKQIHRMQLQNLQKSDALQLNTPLFFCEDKCKTNPNN